MEKEKAMTAREIRERAWGKLGENGGWNIAIGGSFLAFLVSWIVNSLTQSLCGLTTLTQMSQNVQAGTLAQEELVKALPGFMGGMFVAVLVAYYVNAVLRYGFSALSIAVMRGGARIGHVFSGFGKGWSTLWLMALAHLYIFCWTLLFVIPGIRAAFSYALIYLIKADHPDWDADRCIGESKRLMEGNRWRYFCLCLSFLGWWMLVVATCGIAFIFVVPYFNVAQAAFYEDLLDRDTANMTTPDYASMAMPTDVEQLAVGGSACVDR